MPQQEQVNNDAESEQSFTSHLLEIRKRLLTVVYALLAAFAFFAFFASDIYSLFAKPLMDALPDNGAMISTQHFSPLS